MFDNMGYIINEKFYGNGENGLLTPKKGVKASENGKGVDRLPIHELTGKVIIMIDSPYKELIKNTQLHNVTNLYSGDHYKVYKRSQIDSENELLKSASKNKIHIILPDLNNKLSNYDISEPFKNGCQMMAMKFQQNDLNLRSYFDLFKNSNNRGLNSTKNASFILKHLTLRSDENIPYTSPEEDTAVLSSPGIQGMDYINLTIKRADSSYEYTGRDTQTKPNVVITIEDHSSSHDMVGDEIVLSLSANKEEYTITFVVEDPFNESKDSGLNVEIPR